MKKNLVFENLSIGKNISLEALGKALATITDDDYNGTNGEEYFITDDNDNLVCSMLDCAIKHFKGKVKNVDALEFSEIKEIIEYVINDNYDGGVYSELEYKIFNEEDDKHIYVTLGCIISI